jgi:hypothetical protein
MPWKSEIPVKVTHTIMVDMCIAEEVVELNNEHGISTQFSCCGHGYKRDAFIKVLKRSVEDMKALGYIQKRPKTDPEWFKPKSEYKCNTKKRKCQI